MHCEKARMLLLEEDRVQDEKTSQTLTAHLEECEACAEIAAGATRMREMARAWVDEAPPPLRFSSRNPGRSFLQWAPLAACLLMAVLVLFRVEIARDDDGFHIWLGGDNASQQEKVQMLVDQALEEERLRTYNAIRETMVQYQTSQETLFKNAVSQALAQTRGEWRDDLQITVAQWHEQRGRDLTLMENQINLILRRQNENASNLHQLATYVNTPK